MSKKNNIYILMNKNIYMPLPSNISYWWNFGSLLGLCLLIQIMSGFFISMFYINHNSMSFESINFINHDIKLGWLIRSIHANGATLFFSMIYIHIGRGMTYLSFTNHLTWISGILILLMLFATAFLGYVLPWGQMSFWGATVITSLLSSIPYLGVSLTYWIWGNFNVSSSTLTRFFSLHFLLPLILTMLVMMHIIFLHKFSSSSPLGNITNLDKIPFSPFFSYKDLNSMMITLMIFMSTCLIYPYFFMDADNFLPANPLLTPIHIQPEWYFLFAYAILRSVPNKLGGVLALISSILILLILTLSNSYKNNNFNYKLLFKTLISWWLTNFILLTFLGSMPLEHPYINMSYPLTLFYFMFFMLYF